MTGLSVADVDAAGGQVSVTLSVATGALTATAGGSVVVSGSGTGALVLTGTLANINTFLAGGSAPLYVPVANASGTVVLTMTTSDGGNTGTGGTLADTDSRNITINPVNDAPSGANATLTTPEDTPYTFSAANFGFTDVDGNTLQSVIITTLPASGTLALSGVAVTAGQVITLAQIPNLTWTPALDNNGTAVASFTFQVTDTGGTANGGVNTDQSANTITFNVTAVVDIANDPVTTAEDAAVTTSVLGNDSFEGTPVVTTVTQGANGTVTTNGTTTTYTPNLNFTGTDSYTYTVTSGGVTETATVNVTVTAVNDAPVNALPAGWTTNEDISVQLTGLSVADVDAAGGQVSVPNGADNSRRLPRRVRRFLLSLPSQLSQSNRSCAARPPCRRAIVAAYIDWRCATVLARTSNYGSDGSS